MLPIILVGEILFQAIWKISIFLKYGNGKREGGLFLVKSKDQIGRSVFQNRVGQKRKISSRVSGWKQQQQ